MEKIKAEVVVVGAGPGGYAAAFYAADLGKKVILIEKDDALGGVCLNRGCIPSKALLNATKMIRDSDTSADRGISFSTPKIDLKKMKKWKDGIVSKLSSGVEQLAKGRGVTILKGRAYFQSSQLLRVETEKGQVFVDYDKAILAVGSRPAMPAAFDLGNPRIMTSTEALDIEDVPKKLLVIGGGYIGMELGTVYSALGSDVTIVEAMGTILAGADKDLVRPVQAFAKSHFKDTRLNAKVQKMATKGKQISVTLDADGKTSTELFDKVLVSVGRSPNSKDIGLENTGVKIDGKGFVKVNDTQATDDASIYAIGDIAGGVLLAHKASREARIAVEAIVGESSIPSKDVIIPAVVFTEPEIAWCGLTETEAKEQGKKVKVAKFPWQASGRALTMDKTNGLTKIIADPDTDRVLGLGLVGAGAGDMIGEGVLAIEMGATVKDVAMAVHPHPTLSETVMEAAEAYYNHSTHIMPR